MTWENLKSKLEVGSILHCTVKYKNNQFEEIVIDCFGFDAILKLEDISINLPLAKELFRAIKKDDSFNAVVVEFNDFKQKVILNTKVFRTNLNDILSFYTCKNLIENNRKTHLDIDIKFLRSHRNILDRLRGDLSSNELTFLYELIQNAVDHPNKNFNNVSINFEVFNNYLLVKHNGALFTENNFESITGILYGEQIQEGERNRIGYKGIGFKSVFRFTDNAYVRSGNFSFRFSKAESGSDKPWEVLPLFQLEKDMVVKIPQFDFFNAPVAFAFEFNSEQSRNYVIKYLNQLSENPYLLIFLENLTQLIIKAPSLSFIENNVTRSFEALEVNFVKEKTKKDEFDSIGLFVNHSPHSEWLTYTKNDVVISDVEVINELLDESVTSVPSKMRHFRTPRITIALPNKHLNGDIINLFTYLPLSNSKFKLPFLVNADFIPDLDRTDIIHNLKYNSDVLKFVAITLQEFSQKLAINNQYEYLNTLLPDFNIEYQSSGNVIVNNLLDYLPQTKITFNDQLLTISNIAIDKSGFVSTFGLELYNALIDSNNVPLSIISDHKKISKLIEKINPDGVFDCHKLKEKVRSDSFKDWLKNPINNSQFLKFLSKSMHLDLFSDELIFLAQDGELQRSFDLLINLGSDELDILWLNYKQVLNSDVFTMLKDIELPLPKYEPISFINEIICKKKKVEIYAGLNNGSISFTDFYSYLSKYASNPLFPATEIKLFPVKTLQVLLPSWSETIYFNTNSLSKLSSEKAIPDGLFHLIDDIWSNNSNMKLLGERLGVNIFKETEPFNFIQTKIVANKDKINQFYLMFNNIGIKSSVSLWSFILSAYKNLSDTQKENISAIIKTLPVLSKKGSFKELHTLYLPSEFTDNDALETLSLQFPNSNIDFVSVDYLKHPSIEKTEIRTLFKKLDAKTDTKDFLQHTLIPNLHQISTDLFVPMARLLYENRDSEPIINAVIKNTHFKIKTKDGTYKPINECYVGSPYIEESKIPNPIIAVEVVNQISGDYSHNQLDSWQRFFSERLKVKELINEAEIISLKLNNIADNVQQWQSADVSISLLRDIYNLYKSGKLALSSTNLSCIKRLPLLCKGENQTNFHTPNAIHFSSAYKPTFDFEKIFGIECGVPFLSELYRLEDEPELIQFFENIGITQYYDPSRHSVIYQNIPSADGQKKPATQLFKYEFRKYVGPSNIAFEDLSKFKHNGKSLEDYFCFKSKLDVSTILNYISTNEPNKRELKDLICELFKVYNPSSDRNLINVFLSECKLLSSARIYNFVKELYSIDETIRSGIRENEYLIDSLFNKNEQDLRNKYLTLFGIKILGIEDFNPQYEKVIVDFDFKKRVNERLIFLSFDSDVENYLEIEKVFKEKLEQWKIYKCSKISLKYPATESVIIKEDSKTFEINNERVFYYIGSWFDPRVNPVLVDCLSKNVLGLYKQRAFIQDMLLNDPIAIIEDFENKGRAVPDEIKSRFIKPQTTQKEIGIIEPVQVESTIDKSKIEKPSIEEFENPFKDITREDETFIRSIIKGDFELNEKLDANTTAKIKTLMAIKGKYNSNEIIDEGRYLKAGSDEIIVRSAQNGLLYLDVFHWGRLNEFNVSLSIYTKNQVNIFQTQEELINHTKPQNKFGIVRMPNEYSLDDYNSLDNITDKGKWHYVFVVNENTQTAKSYKEVMDYSDPDLFKEDNF
jgi:hypothetical protein